MLNKKRAFGLGFIMVCVLSMLATYFLNKRTPLIIDSTCDFPCWNNITPAKTSKAELLEILLTIPSIDQASVRSRKPSYKSRIDEIVDFYPQKTLWEWYYTSGGQALLVNDRVFILNINADTDITLKQAIQKLGNPDYVFASQPGDLISMNVQLVFRKGVILGFSLESAKGHIVPDQKIDDLTLFDLNDYELAMQEIFHVLPDIPWDGYGNFDEKYWKR